MSMVPVPSLARLYSWSLVHSHPIETKEMIGRTLNSSQQILYRSDLSCLDFAVKVGIPLFALSIRREPML
eukprot:scaffold549_cov174-Ochromonas_danica.AAC.16